MKKAMLTGATGMIGIALVKKLIEQGVECLLLVKQEFVKPNSLPVSPLVKMVEVDLSEIKDFDYPEKDFDTFIHLGWMSTIGDGRNNAELQEANVKVTLDAVRCAARHGCKAFVGTGSQAEYGPKEEVLTGTLSCNPESGYGIAKFAAGKLSRLLANQLGMRHSWVRILSIYGPYDNPNTLISYAIRSLMNKEETHFTKCEQDWDYLFVEDCAYALTCVMDKGKDGKVYPIGGGRTRKLSSYLETIRDIVDPTAKLGIGDKEYPPYQPMFLQADISDLIADTGYEAKYSFEEGIRKTIDFMKENM